MKPNDKAIEAALSVTQIPEENMREYMRRVLTAAYAAQFKSDDYAGLVENLKRDYGFGATGDDCLAAADAIEALLAERDALKSERDAAKQEISEWVVKFQELFDRPTASNERWDAIFCRLVSRGMDHSYAAYIADRGKRRLVSAPVEDEALVKIALQQYKRVYNDTHVTRAAQQRTSISAVIAAIRPHIEAAERERCAKIADDCDKSTHPADVAAAIRRSGK